MLQKVQVCAQLIAEDVAHTALCNTKLGIRIGFGAKTALSGLELIYRGNFSHWTKQRIIYEFAFFTCVHLVIECVLSRLPIYLAKNLQIFNFCTDHKFEVNFTHIANSEIVIAVQCAALFAMTFLSTEAGKSALKFINYSPLNFRFILAWALPVMIFLSGFVGFLNPDFNKVILDRANTCMKWENLKYGTC